MLELAGFYVFGYDIALLFFGTVRELLANGGLMGSRILPLAVPSMSTVFGGFMLLAVMSALFRWIVRLSIKRGEQPK